jgi:hypothetical protein
MKPLLITLFLIANTIFITQSGRHVHQLFFGAQPSVLDQFDSKKQQARSEKQMEVLVADYRSTIEVIRALEKGKTRREVGDIRQEMTELYDKRDALQTEISERERNSRELRDLWHFSGYAIALILVGTMLYRRSVVWPGLALLVSGFAILEYWSSPAFFGGAVAEFHLLLVGKTVVTLLALVLVYLFWILATPFGKKRSSSCPQDSRT